MAKKWSKSFYDSESWQACRDGYIQERIRIDGGLCEVCRHRLGYIVHHKIHLTPGNIGDPEVSLNWKNLSYECVKCHNEHEGHGIKRRRKRKNNLVCEFDEDGNPVGIRPQYERNRL